MKPRDRDNGGYNYEYERMPKRRKEQDFYHFAERERLIPDDYVRDNAGIPTYRTLCLSGLNQRVPDDVLRDAIYKEFKPFGDFNVKVVRTPDGRIAYVNFRYPEDAQEAKYILYDKLVLFDKFVRIEAVYNKMRNNSPPRGSFYRNSSPMLDRRPIKDYGPTWDVIPREEDYRSRDSRHMIPQRHSPKEGKFPHHLHHVRPEDDKTATRILFVGNLEFGISELDLRQVFESYGYVEEIDIKGPNPGQRSKFAFVKFENVDMAYRAKVDMSGQYIGKYSCKIGYGKPTPTKCVWVGGIGPWLTKDALMREFRHFGSIEQIEWPANKNYAYIFFDDIESAKDTVAEMRGVPLGGPDRRIRVDFADPNRVNFPGVHKSGRGSMEKGSMNRDPDRSTRGRRDFTKNSDVENDKNSKQMDRDAQRFVKSGSKRRSELDSLDNADHKLRTHGRVSDEDKDKSKAVVRTRKRYRKSSVGSNSNDSIVGVEDDKRTRPIPGSSAATMDLKTATTVLDLTKCLSVVWSGTLVLKNSAFFTKMYLVSGDVRLVDSLMRDSTTTERPALKITQRLRLDQSKLDEVERRVRLSGKDGFSILLATPGLPHSNDTSCQLQQRPLRNLVCYFKQKDAAGVVSLPPNTSQGKETGLMHAFPPGEIAHRYLSKHATSVTPEYDKDDYLLILVVRV